MFPPVEGSCHKDRLARSRPLERNRNPMLGCSIVFNSRIIVQGITLSSLESPLTSLGNTDPSIGLPALEPNATSRSYQPFNFWTVL